MEVKRADVVPGRTFLVRQDHVLTLDAHRFAFCEDRPLGAGCRLTVLTAPRKIDGINLVRVRVGDIECETFYCDVLKHCET